MRLAYLLHTYPSLSQAFILREVRALRRLGIEVATFSVLAPDAESLLARADLEEAAGTRPLLPPRAGRYIQAHLGALSRAPRPYLSTLREAFGDRPPGARGAVNQLAIFAMAILFAAECRRRRITHVHTHFAGTPVHVAALASRFRRRRGEPATWSWSLHGSVEFSDVERYQLALRCRQADFLIGVSWFGRSQILMFLPTERWDDVHVVRCGIEPSRFSPPQRSPPGRALRVMTLGRLIPQKGQRVLIQALARARAAGAELELVLVGDGPERAALEQLVDALGLRDHVTFAGAVGQDDVVGYYERADLFCSSSFAEGLPVVLMEAMAMELPVVATRITGVPELVADGVTGLLTTPGDADDLAAALVRLASDPAERARLTRAGRERVLEEFDVDRSARRLAELFEATVAPG